VGVACDLGYPCTKFRLPRPFGFRVRADVRDIRQTDADHRIMPPRWGHNNRLLQMRQCNKLGQDTMPAVTKDQS